MNQPQRLASALALWSAGLSLGCSATDETGSAELELSTWWSQPSERRAIEAVIAVYEAGHPRSKVRVLYADNPDVLTRNINARLADGTPPTAFQANLGGNALHWAESVWAAASSAASRSRSGRT